MSRVQNDIYVVGATSFAVGLSAIATVKAAGSSIGWYSGYSSTQFKILSGGGTLEIIPAQLAAGISGWGNGYKVGSTEVVSITGPATFYLAATGATMVVNQLLGYAAGSTFA